MSILILSMIWKQPPCSGGELLVLLALADNADEDSWRCWPSLATIARKSAMSRRNAIECISNLEKKGLLIVERTGPGRGKSNVYTLMTPGSPHQSASENGEENSPLEKLKPSSPFQDEKGEVCAEKVKPSSPEPSIEPKPPIVPLCGQDRPDGSSQKSAPPALDSPETATSPPASCGTDAERTTPDPIFEMVRDWWGKFRSPMPSTARAHHAFRLVAEGVASWDELRSGGFPLPAGHRRAGSGGEDRA